jgi:hypothetical protein
MEIIGDYGNTLWLAGSDNRVVADGTHKVYVQSLLESYSCHKITIIVFICIIFNNVGTKIQKK